MANFSALTSASIVDPASGPRQILAGIAACALILWTGWMSCCLMSDHESLKLDDAFITYRYGRNLADGHGFKYNPTDREPTSGFSALLHVGLSAAAKITDVHPITMTRGTNLLLWMSVPFLMALILTGVLGMNWPEALLAGAVGHLLLSSLDEFGPHMASGMETVIWGVIHLACAAWATLMLAGRSHGRVAVRIAGIAVMLAMVTIGPEGPVLAGLYLATLPLARRVLPEAIRRPGFARTWTLTAVTLALFIGALITWQEATFGRLLSNPYYVKTDNGIFGPISSALPGSRIVLEFVSLRLVPVTALLLISAWAARVPARVCYTFGLMSLPLITIILAYARVIHETAGAFRYELPILVPAVIPGIMLLGHVTRDSGRRMMTTLILAVSSLALVADYDADCLRWADAPRFFGTTWMNSDQHHGPLAALGMDLAETGLGQQATILLSGAGSVPYYSDLRAIDWIGLNNNTLCGRDPLTMEQVWAYIGEQEPDVVYSVLPPASPGSDHRDRDRAFWSRGVQRTLHGRGSELFRQWQREPLAEMFWREMTFIRDHCVFGATYRFDRELGEDWMLMAYVRKDSPHAERILSVLRNSRRADYDQDLGRFYVNDPRTLR